MKLTANVFDIDCGSICNKLEEFIREQFIALRRTGIVMPLSGGLDSSTVAASCVRAVGKEKVMGLKLPEKQGNPDTGPAP
jgi:NAD+ synthase